jgi:uncharacterized protein involved in exopolysaccharide biosynthesis
MMKTQDTKSESEQLKEMILLWLKHWWYFVISMLICGIIAVVYLKNKTPIMRVSAKVSLRHDESLTGNPISKGQNMLSVFGFGKGDENIEDETLKMGSQGFVKQVIKTLHLNVDYKQSKSMGIVKKKLYDKSPIVLEADAMLSDTITRIISFSLNVENDRTKVKVKINRKTIGNYEIDSFPSVLKTPVGAFTFLKSAYFEEYDKPFNLKITFTSYDYMTQIYRNSLELEFEKKTSDLINLGINSENTQLAKEFLNQVITNYNTEWDSDKSLVNEKTMNYIESRLQLAIDNLAKADLDIQNFKKRNNLTDIEADVTYYFTVSGELQPALLEAQTQLKTAELIADFVNDETNRYSLIPFSLTTSEQSVANVIGQYNELLTKRNELYKSKIPSDMAKTLSNQVDAQRKALLQSLENVKKGLQITVNNLKNKEAELTKKIGAIPNIEKDYIQLKREQEVQQTIYIYLLEMREQTGAKAISLLPKLKVIDAPYVVNKPVAPSLVKVALATLFFGGLVFPLSGIYFMPSVRNYLRKRKGK